MAQLGADVEQLDRLARTFQTEASRLERSASMLRVARRQRDLDGSGRRAVPRPVQPGHGAAVGRRGPGAHQRGPQPRPPGHATAPGERRRRRHRRWPRWRRRRWWWRWGRRQLRWGRRRRGWRGFAFGAEGSTFRGARAGDGEAFAGAEARGEFTAAYGDLFSTRGWAEGQAGAGAEGSADFTMGDGRIDGEAEGYAFAGLRGEVGQHTSVLGGLVENESTLTGLLGAEAEGNGSFHLGLDGVSGGGRGAGFRRRGRRYTSETSLFGDFAGFGTEAYAEAGAWADGRGPNRRRAAGQFDAGGGFDVWRRGAGRGGAGRQLVRRQRDGTGGVGVRTGVGRQADVRRSTSGSTGSVAKSISAERLVSASTPASASRFSPSGLASDAADVAGDVAEELPVVGGLFR